MAKTESPGSDRAELKKLLKTAGDKPVSMAFAMSKDGTAIIKLDKLKPPRTLEKLLKDEDGSKNHQFGTVVIDPDAPKTAKFIINKEVGGFARKLVVALKGTGFSKVKLVTEDGQSLEDAAGEEEEAEDEAEGATPAGGPAQAAAAPAPGPASSAPPPAAPPPADQPSAAEPSAAESDPANAAGPDAADLTKNLTGLVKQMMALLAADPSRKAELTELATAAQVSLKGGDLEAAETGIDKLRAALAGGSNGAGAPAADAGAAAPKGNGAAAPSAPDGPDPAMVRKLEKSLAVWEATLAKITGDMDKLVKAVNGAAKGHDEAAGFEDDFNRAVAPLLTTVDRSLSDMLARAAKAGSAEEHERVLEEARATVKKFSKFAQAHPVIDHLDSNPFVPMAVGKTLNTTLSAVASIIH